MAVSGKLPPLAVSDSSLTTYNDWLAWKRSLKYYLDAKDIQDPARRLAILLHKGGRQLQDIYATLEPDPKAKQPDNPFEYAMGQLDRHFKPTLNRCYERYVFRQIRQGTDSIEQFVVKLRKQAANCKFSSVEDAICDQIIDGTSNPTLRRKILEQRLEKVHPIVELAKLLDSVNLQTSSMSGEASNTVPAPSVAVARISTKDSRESSASSSRQRCYRCGSLSHEGSDPACPAKEVTCYRCEKKGHFATRCRSRFTRGSEKPSSASLAEKTTSADKPAAKQKVRAIGKDDDSSDEGNVFQLRSNKSYAEVAASNRIPLRFAGLTVTPIIDSGADVNLIDPATWKRLKTEGLQLKEAVADGCVYPYGRKAPLQFQTAVWVPVQSRAKLVTAKFFVLTEDEGDYETIVGRILATQLGILHLGEAIGHVHHLSLPEIHQGKLGKLVGVQLELPINESVRPVAQPCRRVPFALRKKIAVHIAELLSDDVIERAEDELTEWISPIVPIIKKSGEMRLCIDMRLANTAVHRVKYPIPTFEELVAEMTDCEFFSRIDLKSAYHQVEITLKSRKITTFITPGGLFRFKRLYCGIRCAPELFQKLMTDVLHGLSNVRVFFDDMIIFSKSKSEHDRHVRAVLDRLTERGLSVNLQKSTFGVSDINFLGHRLSKNCVRPNESNSEAIENFAAPKNKKDLQSFLGLVNYMSRFIPNFSSITEPLRGLLKRNAAFVWSAGHEKTFAELKQAVRKVKLGILDQGARIQVFADASPVGLGAVLLQLKPGNKYPEILGYASRSLSAAERNYSQIEREALGLVWACERFRMYTLGKPFDLFTDHKPLELLFGPKSKPNARIERWVLRLQNFDYVVRYIEGPKNIADPFSRLGCESPSARSYTETITSTVYHLAKLAVPVAIPLAEFQAESEKDVELVELKRAIHRNEVLPSPFIRVKYELSVVDGLVLRGDRLIPPASLRSRILDLAHEGHPGIESMKRRLRTKVWWPGIDAEAEKTVKKCLSCAAVSRHNPPPPMLRSTLPSSPWEFIAVDFLGPLPDGRYIFVAVDYFSRFVECVFTTNTSSRTTIQSLSQMFARFGIPVRIKTDNATSFSSAEFRHFLLENGITHITSPPLWPQANGEVERQNRSFLKRLQIAALEQKDLVLELSKYLLLYHGTPHATTGKPPADLMLRRQLRDKLPSVIAQPLDFEEVRDADSAAKEKGRVYADSRRKAAPRQILVGDQVLLPASRTNKLSPAFDPNPFTVVEKSDNEVVVQRGSQSFRRSIAAVKPVQADQSSEGSPPPVVERSPVSPLAVSGRSSLNADTPVRSPGLVEISQPSPRAEIVEVPSLPVPGDGPDNQYRSRSGRLVKPPRRLNL